MLKAEVNQLLTDRYGKECGVERTSADGKIFHEHGPVISATGCVGADFTPDPMLNRHRPALSQKPRPLACHRRLLEAVHGHGAERVDLEGSRIPVKQGRGKNLFFSTDVQAAIKEAGFILLR